MFNIRHLLRRSQIVIRQFSQNTTNGEGGKFKRLFANRAVRAGTMLAVTSSLLYAYVHHLDKDKKERQRLAMQPEEYGTPKLGAPFKLTDHNGGVFDSEQDLTGKLAILYFGFTHCPDICPDELDKLGRVVDRLAEAKIELVPIFVTCDPRRDTPQTVKEYLKDFHRTIIGLTVPENGDTEPLQQMAKAFRVYYRPAKTGESDYLLDHSIFYYLLKDGHFVKVYGRGMTSDEIAADIASIK